VERDRTDARSPHRSVSPCALEDVKEIVTQPAGPLIAFGVYAGRASTGLLSSAVPSMTMMLSAMTDDSGR
jgi:hypothetical protein